LRDRDTKNFFKRRLETVREIGKRGRGGGKKAKFQRVDGRPPTSCAGLTKESTTGTPLGNGRVTCRTRRTL